MYGASDSPEMEEQMGIGAALPAVVGLLDPRPQPNAPEVGRPRDAAVAQLARQTYAAAALRAAGGLPPMGKFYSSAELSYSAALAVQTVMEKPWAAEALSHAGFYPLAADLLEERILPRGMFATVADLFANDRPLDPQRLALAREFLGLGFLQYLLDRVDGILHWPTCSTVQYRRRM
jgi:hypothetical protein